jgi:hypothetical protein
MLQINQDGGNTSPAQLLEKEINKYSALTAGTNISIQLQVPRAGHSASSGDEPTAPGPAAPAVYTFQVLGVRGELSGERVGLRAVRVQDADVQVDIVSPPSSPPSS